MIEHLTRKQIIQYRAGTLPPAEEDDLEDHLDACAACRDTLREAVRHADAALAQKLALSSVEAAALAACPDRRLLRRYAENKADAADREIIGAHVEDCPRCARTLESRRRRRDDRVSRFFIRRYRPVLVPLTAALALVILLIAPASSRNTISQRKTLVEQVARQIGEILEEAQPTLKASRAFIRTNPDAYGVFRSGPPGRQHRQARAEALLRLLQTAPQFNRLYYGDRSGDFIAAERLPGGGFQVDHRYVMEDPARGNRRYDRRLYPVIGGELDRIDWSRGRKVDPHTFDLRNRPWYGVALQSRSFAWSVYRFYETRQYGVTASLPLIEDGNVVGVFGIDLELSDLSSDLSRSIAQLTVLSEDARLFIISDTGKEGQIIGHARGRSPVVVPGENEPLLVRDSGEPVVREAVARMANWSPAPGPGRQNRIAEFDVAGHYVAAQTRVESLPWTVLVAVPKRDIQRGAFPAYAVAALGACVGTLLLSAGVRMGKRRRA